MWISNKISVEDKVKKRKATSANVTISEKGNVVVQSSNEYRSVNIATPRGIVYVPIQGDKTIVIPVGDEDVCIGVVPEDENINPGELMLYSSGGAKIILKNNGEVVINGTTIPAVGG